MIKQTLTPPSTELKFTHTSTTEAEVLMLSKEIHLKGLRGYADLCPYCARKTAGEPEKMCKADPSNQQDHEHQSKQLPDSHKSVTTNGNLFHLVRGFLETLERMPWRSINLSHCLRTLGVKFHLAVSPRGPYFQQNN